MAKSWYRPNTTYFNQEQLEKIYNLAIELNYPSINETVSFKYENIWGIIWRSKNHFHVGNFYTHYLRAFNMTESDFKEKMRKIKTITWKDLREVK